MKKKQGKSYPPRPRKNSAQNKKRLKTARKIEKRPSKFQIEKVLAKKHYKVIRPYVSFRYKNLKRLSKKAIKKIETYHDEINSLLARPVSIKRTRSKKVLKAAQKFSGHNPKLNEINVAFIPVTNHDVKVKLTKKGIEAETSTGLKVNYITFDKVALIKDPLKYVRAVIEREHPKAKKFGVRVGEHGIYEVKKGTFDKHNIGRVIKNYMSKYDESNKYHYWGDWLHGLNAYYAQNQKTIDDYRRVRRSKAAAVSKTRQNKRRREKDALKDLGYKYKPYSNKIKRLYGA